jgi:iron complex outermembrane receptor protein
MKCVNTPRHLLRAGLMASAVAALLPSGALAQNDAAQQGADSGMIIVTAQKREQDIQDVPISMSVIGGDTLRDLGVQDFNELDRYIPNFYVQSTPGNNAFYIRGIGSTPGNLAFEQTVGLFIDGIYGGHARQFQAPFLDVERIEVLRGPQGALVGKNTSAGAISVVSARPTRDFYAMAEGSYEFELGGTKLMGVVSGPLSDAVSVRVAGQFEDIDGYIENSLLGGKEPKRKSLFGRASVLIDPGNGADLLVKIEGGKVDLTGNPVESYVTANDPDLVRETGGFPGFTDKDFDDTNSLNASATANIDIGEHTLTSVTGYSAYDFEKKIDADFGPVAAFASSFAEKFNQFSQEIRLASPATGGLEYIVGGYVHVNDYDLFASTLLPTGGSDRAFRQENLAWSGFASATFHASETLRLLGSIRYTYDRKIANQQRENSGTVRPTWLATSLFGRRVEREWDPAATIQWDASDNVMLYATYGQGSKAGGFIGAQADTTQDQFSIDSEQAETYEIGGKFALLDRRLRLNIAAFRTDFTNLQVSAFDAYAAAFVTSNAGKARSQGVESDFTFQIADGFALNGSLAYLDASYLDFPGAPCPYTNSGCVPADNNAAGQLLARSPKWSGTLFADATVPVGGNLEFIANGGASFRSRAFLEESYNPAAAQKGFAKFDLRLGLRRADKRWEVALVGKNLTNELTAGHAFNTPTAADVISKFVQPPRTIALQLRLQN